MIVRPRTSSAVLLVLAALVSACAVEYTVPRESDEEMCAPGLLACDGGCVDPTLTPAHCGACDRACETAEACVQGECVGECDPGEMMCEQLCIAVASDPANCGACGRQCDSDEVCDAGTCVEACDASCDNDVELCVDGECTCRDGFVLCDGECVDISTDKDHCGMCGRDCGEQPCGGGECQPDDCPGFPDLCEYSCTDVQSDPLNCGECEHECHPSQDCVGGLCVSGGSG